MTTVVIRPFQPTVDSGFIYSTWPKSMYYGSYYDIPLAKKRWFKICFEHIKEILQVAKVYVACKSDDQDFILGYSVVNGTGLEFVYVKEAYRIQGIGRILTNNKNIKECVNITKIGKAILDDHPDLFKAKSRLETIEETIKENVNGDHA